MAFDSDSPVDRLWREYGRAFQEMDDHTLARWLVQTLGQFQGQVWRNSHPLVGTYRLAAQLAHSRQIWLKRLVATPSSYIESECCRAPGLPLLTRDVVDPGLICQHCGETLSPFEDMPGELRAEFSDWAARYSPIHAVAHWDDRQRKSAGHYERAFEDAAQQAEKLLAQAGRILAPKLLEFHPTIIWEDHDECLEVRPEDIHLD
jgi:hypothetical protein